MHFESQFCTLFTTSLIVGLFRPLAGQPHCGLKHGGGEAVGGGRGRAGSVGGVTTWARPPPGHGGITGGITGGSLGDHW